MLANSTDRTLAEQHLDRAAFAWKRRLWDIDSHARDFSALVKSDQALYAGVRAFSLSAGTSAEYAVAKLREPVAPDEMFVLAACGIGRQDANVQGACVDLVQAMPSLRQAYASALQWLTPAAAEWALNQWSASASDALCNVFTAFACCVHPALLQKVKGNARWEAMVQMNDNQTLALYGLMHCALQQKDAQLTARAYPLLDSTSTSLRCAAADVLLANPPKERRLAEQVIDTLLEVATGTTTSARHAALMLATLDHPQSSALVSALASNAGKSTEQERLYLQALAWSGDLRHVPLLQAQLNHPANARLAGASLSLLTGSLPEFDGWKAETPRAPRGPSADGPAIPPSRIDSDLPQPDADGFARWWSRHGQQLPNEGHVLAGKAESRAHLLNVLRSGKLTWRAIAARRLQAYQPGPPLLTEAPAHQQQQWLASATS